MQFLNIIGLVVSLIGTILLYKYGVSYRRNELGALQIDEPTPKFLFIELTLEFRQKSGFFLLAGGFLIQIVAQFLSNK